MHQGEETAAPEENLIEELNCLWALKYHILNANVNAFARA